MKLGRVLGPFLLVTASLVLGVVVAEGTVRVYARGRSQLARDLRGRDPFAVKVEPMGPFGYRQRPGTALLYDNGTKATANALGFRGPLVAVPKPAGTLRVVLLGGSTTHGWFVNDDQTIDAYLRRDLAAELPGRRVEVVNLAYDGYDAYEDWQRWATDGLRFDPDVVVFNDGINDVRNARLRDLGDPDPRTLLWEDDMPRLRAEAARGGPTPWSWAKHYLYLARLPGILRETRSPVQRGPSPDERVYPDAANNFELNVRRIVGSAVGHGIAVVLSTPPSALMLPGAPANMAPRSYWVVNRAVTQAYRDTLSARLQGLARSYRGTPEVLYVSHDVPAAAFLDDCHLKPAGNRVLAADFARVLLPLLRRRMGGSAPQDAGGVSQGPPSPRTIAEYPPTM